MKKSIHKTSPRKLVLRRETIAVLERSQLRMAGGMIEDGGGGGGCDSPLSGCVITTRTP